MGSLRVVEHVSSPVSLSSVDSSEFEDDDGHRSSKRRRISPAEDHRNVSESESESDSPKLSPSHTYNEHSRIRKQNSGPAAQSSHAHSLANSASASNSLASFNSIALSPWLLSSLRSLQIHTPTPIQSSCIPPILNGLSCLGSSRTGTGKTLAFALPILHAWSLDPFGTFAVVLTPTRELATQIYEQFAAIGAPQDLKVCLVTGGVEMRGQAIALAARPHVVVSTPGRLADHIRTSGKDTTAGLGKTRFVVLDEADRLLAPEARMLEDLETCLSAVPGREYRQTLLFTATVTPEVRALANMAKPSGKSKQQRGEVFICEIADSISSDFQATSSSSQRSLIPPRLRQTYMLTPSPQKLAYLHVLLLTPSFSTHESIMVFTNRTSTADLLHRALLLLSHRTTALHSRLPQSARARNLADFRGRRARILVCTDVGSRGLDIEGVGAVVNYDVPRDPSDYVHRVGRTARAGRDGLSVTLVGARDVDLVLAIEEGISKQSEESNSKAEKNKTKMQEWSEEGVNIETRVVKDGGKVLKEVGLARMEATRMLESGRDVNGRAGKLRKAR